MGTIYIDAESAAIANRIKVILNPLVVKQYYIEIPDGFTRPSIYFERSRSISNVFSNTKYQKAQTMAIKVFDKRQPDFDSWEKAKIIEDSISENRMIIQMIDTSGDLIDNYIKINQIEVRKITQNSTNITFSWNSQYKYKIDIATLLQNITVNTEVLES